MNVDDARTLLLVQFRLESLTNPLHHPHANSSSPFTPTLRKAYLLPARRHCLSIFSLALCLSATLQAIVSNPRSPTPLHVPGG